MVSELEHLSASEQELFYKAPLLVCILIAGADGKIDRKEIQGAIKFAEAKQKMAKTSVGALFKEVKQDFEDKLKMLLQGYPYETTQRNPLIVDELSQLNTIFPKVEISFAKEFYNGLINIAQKIASSSGGLWGMNKVGAEEAMFVKLEMIINPSNKT